MFSFFFLPFVFFIYDDGDLRLKERKLALILKINRPKVKNKIELVEFK